MTLCLNTKSAYNDFNMLVNDRYFVDKSDIIEKISERIKTKNRYVCITKPRHFGKTSVLNMLGSYYCRTYDSKTLFDGLNISKCESYTTHLNGYCQSYWTRTGKMDEVLFFLKYNIGEVRDDVVKMVNDTPVIIDIKQEYSAGQEHPASRKDIYSAMIIYGLLSYCEGELRIPNKELMIEFENALEDDDFGYVAELVRNSDEVLYATLDKKGDIVASYLHDIHNSELPILKYNDENSLSCVVTLAYLSARNKYRIEREEKSGKGFVDFIFYPRRKNLPGIILELKSDKTPAEAIKQIKEKEYNEKLKKENVSHILAVGLNYDSTKKEHQCIIEELT